MPSSHLILCRPLLLLPSIPPSNRVFSNESTLCMRWPKYWSLQPFLLFEGHRLQCMFKDICALVQVNNGFVLELDCAGLFSKPGFSNMWTVNFQMFKLILEKAEESEIKLPTSAGSWKKQESSRKTSISALLTMPKPLTVWITINCGKFWKRWEYQNTWSASWEICMQVRKQQLDLDMEQQTGSK